MNNITPKKLEFIQITCSVEFTPESSLPASLSGDIRISCFDDLSSTPVENVRQIGLFLQNEPNFHHFSPKNEDHNEKQTQNEPKRTQFWPKKKDQL
jgi:hypothetical protein